MALFGFLQRADAQSDLPVMRVNMNHLCLHRISDLEHG